MITYETKVCPRCRGSGRDSKDQPCARCGGDGKVTTAAGKRAFKAVEKILEDLWTIPIKEAKPGDYIFEAWSGEPPAWWIVSTVAFSGNKCRVECVEEKRALTLEYPEDKKTRRWCKIPEATMQEIAAIRGVVIKGD